MTPKEFQKIIEKEVEAILAKEIPQGPEYDEVRNAHKWLHMLAQGLKSKESVEATLRWIVVGVAESKSWIDCQPNLTRWPRGFESHNDFIWEAIILAGLDGERRAKNIKSRLIKVADLAAFASDHNITIDEALNNNWSKLRDGLPTISRVISGENDEEAAEHLEEILDDVQELSPKEFKSKYVKPRHEPAGTATIQTTPHGVAVVVAVLNSPADRERVAQILGGLFNWGLPAKAFDNGRNVAISIEGAQVSDVFKEQEEAVA